MGAASSTSATARVAVIVSDDGLHAWLRMPAAAAPPPTREELLAAVAAARIAITDEVTARVDEYLRLAGGAPGARPVNDSADAAEPELPEQYLVAEGQPAIEAQNGSFEWEERLARESEAETGPDAIDYFHRTAIHTVDAGVIVGRLHPPKPGRPGLDVFGQELPPRRREGTPVRLGAGLALTPAGEVAPQKAGRVLLVGDRLLLEERLNVKGDVDFETGSLDVCVDVTVHGTVQSNFRVHTTGSLTVGKAIEAADVEVGKDIFVRGGICGQGGQGRVRAGGSLAARFCGEVRVTVGGELRFEKEIINSTVYCQQRVIGPNGAVIGGFVWAGEGLLAGVLGSEAGVATRVAVGMRPDVLRRAREMEARQRERSRAIERIRRRIQPLLVNIKRLTAQQHEMLKELTSKADELETERAELSGQHERIMLEAQPKGQPGVEVQKIAHPGVRVSIGARQVELSRPLSGPVRIETRKVEGVTEIVAVNQRSGSVTILPSMEIDWAAAVQPLDVGAGPPRPDSKLTRA